MCRKCEHCDAPLDESRRAHARFCNAACRKQEWRIQQRVKNFSPELRGMLDMLAKILPETAKRLERLIALERSQKPVDVIRVILYAHTETNALQAA